MNEAAKKKKKRLSNSGHHRYHSRSCGRVWDAYVMSYADVEQEVLSWIRREYLFVMACLYPGT